MNTATPTFVVSLGAFATLALFVLGVLQGV